MMLRSMTQWRSHCLSRGDANTAIGCLVLWWSEMARYVSVIHKNPSSFARGSRRLPLPPRILICAAFFVPPPSFPSFLFFFPALIALRHVAALLRKNFPEQRQKLCSPARAPRSLPCLSLQSRRLEREEKTVEGGPFHGHRLRLRRRWFKKLSLSHFPEASS